MKRLLLIVDPDRAFVDRLATIGTDAGFGVTAHLDFVAARTAIDRGEPSMLVANVRLGMFNGIHLAYIARHTHPGLCSLIYGAVNDALLAREAQVACAFYAPQSFVPALLPRFLTSALPPLDRRKPLEIDRRGEFRGGRRITDVGPLRASLSPGGER